MREEDRRPGQEVEVFVRLDAWRPPPGQEWTHQFTITASDGYTTVDGSLSAALGITTITLSASNLLDEQYITYFGQAATNLADRYFAGRGRTFSLRAETRF